MKVELVAAGIGREDASRRHTSRGGDGMEPPDLLARDREPAIRYEGSLMYPSPRELWG